MQLSPTELENLSKLLLSNDENIEIGLQILNNYAETEIIKLFHKELILLKMFSPNNSQQKKSMELLARHYDEAQLEKWKEAFWIFENMFDLYEIDDFEKNWHYFEKHEAVRLDFSPYIQQNIGYVQHYFAVADSIARYYKKQLPLAEEYLLFLEKNEPTDTTILRTLANIYQFDYKDNERALEYFDKILEIDKDDEEAWESKGILFLEGFKDIDKAIDVFKKAVSLFPKNDYLPVWLSDAYMTKDAPESYAKGKTILEKVLKKTPKNNFAWTIYANHLWVTERNIKAAEEAYLQGLKNDDEDVNLLANLAELYDVEYQNYEVAQDFYLKAFGIYMDDIYHLCNFISLLVLKVGNLEDGKDYYKHLKSLVYGDVQRDSQMNDLQWENFQKAEGVLMDNG